MTHVAILWHMHQPYYEDLATREHVLPWVRLHGLKDYYGMVALLHEFPGVKVTFNLVPSLLVQLEAFADERARDWHLELGLKPAASLTDAERNRMLREFFHAPRGRMIDPYPRYAELLRMRDTASGFDVEDYLDLQVWHKLSWVDPFYFDADPRIARLLSKQRDFNEADKQELREVELEILRKIIPEYRAAAERDQVELSTSPFYHPILPLLCDSDVYLVTHPTASVPRPPFRRPEDAAEQLRRARQCHERLFGHQPAGVWPSEGSVSDAVARLAADLGFRWMATDEAILGRTIGQEFRRDGQGRLENPEPLYRPYKWSADGAEIGFLFRDHTLSDLIGFVYAGWDAHDAASDFVSRLEEAGRRFTERTGGEDATLIVILDGENAWEHFDGGGRPFLREMYRQLAEHRELKTVTMDEASRLKPSPLTTIFPGSWIDGNFFIWAGHADDVRAWRQIREAREMYDRLGESASTAEAREAAFQELLIAEGSDWFWWYGDDHSSEHDLEFDDLFRRHLRNVYQMLGQPVPEELFGTNISTGRVPLPVETPVGLISPVLDGRTTSYFEWLPAGSVETELPAGAMTGAERRTPVLRTLQFGYDLNHLYLRMEMQRPADQVLSLGMHCCVNFTTPTDRRLLLAMDGKEGVGTLYERTSDRDWRPMREAAVRLAIGDVVEAAILFRDLQLTAKDPFAFFVSVQKGANEVERHPVNRPIEGLVPEASFEKLNWKA